MLEMFDERYAALTKSTTATFITIFTIVGGRGGGSSQYRDFSNTKRLEFEGITDPIVAIRCILDV